MLRSFGILNVKNADKFMHVMSTFVRKYYRFSYCASQLNLFVTAYLLMFNASLICCIIRIPDMILA